MPTTQYDTTITWVTKTFWIWNLSPSRKPTPAQWTWLGRASCRCSVVPLFGRRIEHQVAFYIQWTTWITAAPSIHYENVSCGWRLTQRPIKWTDNWDIISNKRDICVTTSKPQRASWKRGSKNVTRGWEGMLSKGVFWSHSHVLTGSLDCGHLHRAHPRIWLSPFPHMWGKAAQALPTLGDSRPNHCSGEEVTFFSGVLMVNSPHSSKQPATHANKHS